MGGMSSTTKSELELVAMEMEKGVAMTTVSGCYDNMSGLLWGYVLVAMGTRYGKVPMPCGCVGVL